LDTENIEGDYSRELIVPNPNLVIADPLFDEEAFFSTIGQMPHKKQLLAHKLIDHPDVNTLCIIAHRRWGKSIFMKQIIEKYMLKYPEIVVFLGAPTYKFCTRVCDPLYKDIKKHWRHFVRGKLKYSRHEIGFTLVNGSTFIATGMDNPDSALGQSIDIALFDEFQSIPTASYELFLPAIADKQRMGKQIICGTPRFAGLFHDIATSGLSKEGHEMGEYTLVFPYDEKDPAPYVKEEYYKKQKKKLPKARFEAEWLCKFMTKGGEVFRYSDQNFMPPRTRRVKPGEWIFIGVDFAIGDDYTVVTCLTADKKMVGLLRFSTSSWNHTLSKIKEFILRYSKYNPCIISFDSTAIGDRPTDELVTFFSSHPNIGKKRMYKVKFDAKTKNSMVETMQMELEVCSLVLWDLPEIKEELSNFTYYMSQQKNIKYSASSGKHDDIITAIMLALYSYSNRNKVNIQVI